MNKTIKICLTLTLILFGIFFGFICGYGFPTQLNAIGDSLAGFSSSLALIWLVGSIFLQHEELRSMRGEYTFMRKNMDIQTENQNREILVKTTQLYISTFDSIAEQLFAKSSLIKDIKIPNISSYMFLGYLYNKCDMLDEGQKKPEFFALKDASLALSIDIQRYKKKYKEIQSLLKVSDLQDVYDALLAETIYEQIMNTIVDAENHKKGSLVQLVFNDE